MKAHAVSEHLSNVRRSSKPTTPLNIKDMAISTGHFLALRDARFKFPARVAAIPKGANETLGAEALPELDADFIFGTYRADTLETPNDAIANLEAVLPDFCSFLHACRESQFIVIPREEASATVPHSPTLSRSDMARHWRTSPVRSFGAF